MRKQGKQLAQFYLAGCGETGLEYRFLSCSSSLLAPHQPSLPSVWSWGHQIRAGLWCLLYLDLTLGKVVKWMGPCVSLGPWPPPSVPFPLLESPNPFSGIQRPHNLFSWLVKTCFLGRNWYQSLVCQCGWIKTLCFFLQGALTVKASEDLFLIEECQTLFPGEAFWVSGSTQGPPLVLKAHSAPSRTPPPP